MQRKSVFFTSDWHIGHENIIKFSKRPFADVAHMAKVLINNHNSTVPKDGLTYFLGDMGLCKAETLKAVIDQLNGTKVLILGNHDKNHEAMYKLGFDVVLNGATMWIAHQQVTMSHCPLLGIQREDTTGYASSSPGDYWHGERKNGRFTTRDHGQFHLHGHIHSPNDGHSQKILDRQFDVGVDANGYRPVSISQIESWIAKYGRVG